MLNPFSQGGQWSSTDRQPSVFGALPFSSPPSPPSLVTFTFRMNRSILNCEIVGPLERVYYRVRTDERENQWTSIHSEQRPNIGHVEWKPDTMVEFHRFIPRQRASGWIKFDQGSGVRTMIIADKSFIWIADNRHIYLQNSRCGGEFTARITQHAQYATLEIVAQALHNPGLLEACIMSTIMFLSGRDIS